MLEIVPLRVLRLFDLHHFVWGKSHSTHSGHSVPHLLLDPLGPLLRPHYQSCHMCEIRIINISHSTSNVTHLVKIESRSLSTTPPSTHISPCCRDEFLLRPVVHVITVVTARWSVIHFWDLCIPITKWRLLWRLCVCPAWTLCRMLKRDEASEVTRVNTLRLHYPPLPRLHVGPSLLVFGLVWDVFSSGRRILSSAGEAS